MTTQSAIKHWEKLADYDWKSAHAMFKTKRFLYVGFLCHQVIEKLYKAFYTKLRRQIPPFTHDLIKLASLTVTPPTEAGKKQLNILNPLYIKCRYPAYKIQLSRILNRKKAVEVMNGTEEVRKWLKSQLI